ncbi:hypothetical protein CCAX7_59980 [Capsulimonas corticalis]|uniref:Intracellular proteinase inhibitor BsuPI domain-containing protein n=1 Tax=Capsulimonas corticalis TaxID=2219043 RepID=A0A9N7LAI7_9BACT|nr:hypothetical protein CCAX7_59980 [Capsulimonas corticalis]
MKMLTPKNTILVLSVWAMLAYANDAHAGVAPKKTTASSNAAQPLRATLTLKTIHPSFYADEPVVVDATVKNISRSPVSVQITGPADAYEITVVQHPGNESRKSLYYDDLSNRHELLSIRIQPLKLGEQYTERMNLSRLYDLTLNGKYQVQMNWKVSFAEDASTVDHLSSDTQFFVANDNKPTAEK